MIQSSYHERRGVFTLFKHNNLAVAKYYNHELGGDALLGSFF
jgi:hypothetical protein